MNQIDWNRKMPKPEKVDQRKLDITKLAKLTHMDQEGIKRGLDLLEYDFVDFIDTVEDMQGYVAKNHRGQVLMFRESEAKVKDWLNNANILTMEIENKKYHEGYGKLITNNIDRIMKNITDKRLVTGGFSQGGGLSEAISNYLADTTDFKTWFANLDGPAVIKNRGYKNGIRTIHSNDPVPLSTLLFGYEHWVDLVYWTFTGKTYINPSKILKRIDFFMQTGEDLLELAIGKKELEHNISRIDENWSRGIDKIKTIL